MSKIEWTGDSWNPIVGCSIKSPGCKNCYAMGMAHRIQLMGTTAVYDGLTEQSKAGPVWNGKLAFSETALLKPLKRKNPQTYFVNSMGDLFHEDVPDKWIDRVFAVMALCPQHTFQVLTKRADRMREYFSSHICQTLILDGFFRPWIPGSGTEPELRTALKQWPLPNVWLGVSVEDQQRANERIPDLLETPAAIRWLSCEPLLGALDLERVLFFQNHYQSGANHYVDVLRGGYWSPWGPGFRPSQDNEEKNHFTNHSDIKDKLIDWVVCGGESGPKARPMHPDWARSLRDQCKDAGVPFFFKQWGKFLPCEIDQKGHLSPPMPMSGPDIMSWRRWEGSVTRPAEAKESIDTWFAEGVFAIPVGKVKAGRLLDGIEHNGKPTLIAQRTA